MLACFGLAWPMNLAQMIRQRRAIGRNLAFTVLIWSGYVVGTLAKLLSAELTHSALPAVFWLYVLNTVTVGANALLHWHFESRPRWRKALAA